MEFVRQSLSAWRLPSKTIASTLLTVEELLVQLVKNAQPAASVTIRLSRAFGAVEMRLSCLGSPFDAQDLEQRLTPAGDMSPEESLAIQTLVKRVTGDAVVTTIVAKWEKAMDVAVFQKA